MYLGGVNLEEQAFICAEIGQNHNGDAYLALRLMAMAERCGVDGIKLQYRDHEYEQWKGTLPRNLDEPYHSEHSYGETYGDHRAKLDFKMRQFLHLKQRHRYNEYDSTLFVTPCSPNRLGTLEHHGFCPFYKIASKDLGDLDLIRAAADTGKPVILSTGMANDWGDIKPAVEVVADRVPFVVCHSVSKYPTPLAETNLRAIRTLRLKVAPYGGYVGFSDHTPGIRTSIAARALGAVYIEKHITMARTMKGRDHAASLEEPGLRLLVSWIRDIETAFGDGLLRKTQEGVQTCHG